MSFAHRIYRVRGNFWNYEDEAKMVFKEPINKHLKTWNIYNYCSKFCYAIFPDITVVYLLVNISGYLHAILKEREKKIIK